MAVKEYFLPQSVEEAVSLLADHGPELLVMAGGTIAMPLINEGVSLPETVMGLRQAGLDKIEKTNGSLSLGAGTTLTHIIDQDHSPLLAEAAHNVGGWAIRNMGTVGGNLFAPPPAGDFAVALLALDAMVKIASKKGIRHLPLAEFFTGFMTNALEPGELVTGFEIPIPNGETAYLKFGRKHANTPAVVTVATRVVMQADKVSDARIALNAVASHPIRAYQAEKALVGTSLDEAAIAAAASAAAEECEPFTDAIASEWYRRKMVPVFVRRTLEKISGGG
ncbi:MAG: FAD binding domain-containing protein [Anaerolineales bacterium]|nr:FAD binding domain-containing protein [Anaerolineales bacterium]